jgi:hypothetical protein
MVELEVSDTVRIGRNDHGYEFAVGRSDERWIGFVKEYEDGARGVFVFSGIHEGYKLGITDRDRAIRLTAAMAQDPEHGYGGISEWFVAENLRATPDEMRCEACGELPCVCDDD